MVVNRRNKILAAGRFGVAAVEKSAVVAGPRWRSGKFHPVEIIGKHRASGDLDHPDAPPVAAAILHRIGEQFAIGRGRPFRQRGGAVLGPAIGIDKRARRCASLFDHQHRLVLQAAITAIKYPAAAGFGQRDAFIIEQLRQPRLERRPAGQGRQIGLCHLILFGHPIGHRLLGAHVALKPAIGVGNCDTVQNIALRDGGRDGIGQRCRHCRNWCPRNDQCGNG